MGQPFIFYRYTIPTLVSQTGYYPTGYTTWITEATLTAKYHGSRWASGLYSSGSDNKVAYGQYEPWYSYLRLAQHLGGDTELESYAVHASTGWRYYSNNNNGAILGYYNYTDGNRLHWTTNADTGAKFTVLQQSVNASYATPFTPISYISGEGLSRETAYALLGWINAEVYCGTGHNAGFQPYMNVILGSGGQQITYNDSITLSIGGHIEQWLGGIQTDNSGNVVSGTENLHRFQSGELLTYTGVGYTGTVEQGFGPFMGAITAWTLIQAYENSSGISGNIGRDSRTIPKLTRLFDAIWPYYAVTGYNGTGMTYRWNTTVELKNVSGVTTGVYGAKDTSPDYALNNMMAVCYWWLYKQSGQQRFLNRGDALFNGTIGYDSLIARPSVSFPPLYNVKEFNELTRWTIDGLEWRRSGVQLYG